MKKTNKLFSTLKKGLCLALVCAVALSNPISASAKKVTAAPTSRQYDFELSTVDSIATPITSGTHTVTVKNKKSWYYGYLKFTAPTTKTYTIKISNIKTNKKKAVSLGRVDVMSTTDGSNVLSNLKLQTKGKEKSSMQLGTKKYKNYFASRTAKVKLEAGQTIYLYYSFVGIKNGSKLTSKLSIK